MGIFRLTRAWAHRVKIVEADTIEDARQYARVEMYDLDVADLGVDQATRGALDAEIGESLRALHPGLSAEAALIGARGRRSEWTPTASVRVPAGLGRLTLQEATDVVNRVKPMPRSASAPPAGSGGAAPLRERESPALGSLRAEVEARHGALTGGREVDLREVTPLTMPGGGVIIRPPGRSSGQGGADGDLVERFRRLGLSEEAARLAAADTDGGGEELRRHR